MFVTSDTQYVLQNFEAAYGNRPKNLYNQLAEKDFRLILAPAGASWNVEVHMCLLTLCDHLIITGGSSYSWWAAYLLKNPDGKVVYNKNYLIKGTFLYQQTRHEDYMYPKWIGL